MQRSNTLAGNGKTKKGTSKTTAATKDWNSGFKRRNSTTVSSLKIKKNPPVQVVVNEHKSLSNSLDEDDAEVFGDGNAGFSGAGRSGSGGSPTENYIFFGLFKKDTPDISYKKRWKKGN